MAWSNITNAEIDPESPGTTGLFGKYRDNQEALYDARACIVKAGDETINNSAVLQDDDELKFSVLANQTWTFRSELIVVTNDVNADFRFNFTAPAGTWRVFYRFYDTSAAIATLVTNGSGTFANGGGDGVPDWVAAPLVATPGLGVLTGWVKTTAAGIFQLQWACRAAAGAGKTTTVKADSYLVAHQDHTTM